MQATTVLLRREVLRRLQKKLPKVGRVAATSRRRAVRRRSVKAIRRLGTGLVESGTEKQRRVARRVRGM